MRRSKLLIFILAVVMSLGICSAALAAEVPVIVVEGSGETSVMPDKAVVNFGIVTTAKTAQLAQAENAKIASDVMSSLSGLGIFSKDIQTHYSMSPVYEKNNYRKIEGYQATNTFVVTVNNIDQVSTAIDTALANGATRVNGLRYELKDEKAVRNTALQAAVLDARNKADTIANALGVKIIGVQRVTEGGGSMPRFEAYNMKMMATSADNATATPVSAGTIDVSATVHIEYQIQ